MIEKIVGGADGEVLGVHTGSGAWHCYFLKGVFILVYAFLDNAGHFMWVCYSHLLHRNRKERVI